MGHLQRGRLSRRGRRGWVPSSVKRPAASPRGLAKTPRSSAARESRRATSPSHRLGRHRHGHHHHPHPRLGGRIAPRRDAAPRPPGVRPDGRGHAGDLPGVDHRQLRDLTPVSKDGGLSVSRGLAVQVTA